MHETIDNFLGGKIRLKQGDYRATSDAVLLASAIQAKSGESVLDVGCGTGAVFLCLMARIRGLEVSAVDSQLEMVQLAKENALLNEFKVNIEQFDITDPPNEWKEKQFNHVITNPPYFTEEPQRLNLVVAKAHQQQIDLAKWLDFCIKKVKAKGTLTLIHRTEAVPQILSILSNRMGKITLIPLYPKQKEMPKRVIIQATMNSKTPFILKNGFVLHNDDNTRTDWAEKIMRRGIGLFD